jgi:phospholipid/cholesterol/gamma-HCH transport system substrate-binding protein
VRRIPASVIAAVVAMAVVLVAVGAVLIIVFRGPDSITISAVFRRTPGLFPGNHVDVLGIPVGTIKKVTAEPHDVIVVMSVHSDVKVPADAKAVLMAPGVVNDRYVELTPAYSDAGGPVLKDDANIPLSNTAIPLDTNQILGSIDSLTKALGPEGANRNGALSLALHNVARELNGNGKHIHATTIALSKLVGSLSGTAPELAATIRNLAGLTQTLAANDALYRQFSGDLASVTQTLADNAPALGRALRSLSMSLGQVKTFVDDNHRSLANVIDRLSSVVHVVAQHEQDLVTVYNVGPLALSNFARTVYHRHGQHPIARARYDGTAGRHVLEQLCGDEGKHLFRLGQYAMTGSGATTFDLMCASDSTLAQEPSAPGAPPGDPITVEQLVAGMR